MTKFSTFTRGISFAATGLLLLLGASACEQTFNVVLRQSDQLPAYANDPVLYTKGSAIAPNAPQNLGRVISGYQIDSGLPPGLFFDPVTGVISGQPTGTAPVHTYTITASYNGGSKTLTLVMRVRDAAPAGLSYAMPVLQRQAPLTPVMPSVSGGVPTSYKVSPALPAGLTLDPASGIISGTPQAVLPATGFTVTASNETGSVSTTFTIKVRDIPPATLAYSTNPAVYGRAVMIAPNGPIVTGGVPTSFVVSPALPAGLVLDPVTGIITGLPTMPAAAATYTVTAANDAGSASVGVSIAVVEMMPQNLAYNPATIVLVQGQAATPQKPSYTNGAPTSYAITPALPSGVTFDPMTGIIAGTPTVTSASTSYTVTGTNSAGSATATIYVTVLGMLTANAQTLCLDNAQGPFGRPVTLSLTDPTPANIAYTFAIATPPSHGTLSALAPTGALAKLTYSSLTGYVGTDTFAFKVMDQYGRMSLATVTINVGNQIKTVATAADLDAVRNDLYCKYQQTADIDLLNSSVNPIGDANVPFMGTYDGLNHSILHWSVLHVNNDYMGPFGYLNGRVQNLTLGEVSVASTSGRVGGVAGIVLPNGAITNVNVVTSLTGNGSTSGEIHGGWEFGGIAARNQGGVITAANFNGRMGSSRIVFSDSSTGHQPHAVNNFYIGGVVGSNESMVTYSGSQLNVYAGPVNVPTVSDGNLTAPVYAAGIFSVDPSAGRNLSDIGVPGVLQGNFYYGSIQAAGGISDAGYLGRTYILPNGINDWSNGTYLSLTGVPVGSLYEPTDRNVYAGGVVGRNIAGNITRCTSTGYYYLYDVPAN